MASSTLTFPLVVLTLTFASLTLTLTQDDGSHLQLLEGLTLQEKVARQEPRMYYVGAVEGKSYFMDNTQKRTWKEALDYCKSIGLRLASITSPGQNLFLGNKRDILGIGIPYWTGGRDALTEKQFVWDHNEESVVTNWQAYGYPNLRNALIFIILSLTPPYNQMSGVSIDYTYFTLCEGV